MFSIIIPINNVPGDNRYDLLEATLAEYHRIYPNMYERFPGLELILITATEGQVSFRVDKVVRYSNWKVGDIFNPSVALNLGVKESSNESIIITCPEIFPLTPVLDQFAEEIGNNVLAQVFGDAGIDGGKEGKSLISTTYRNEFPGLYFLAMYNKKDILAINGWDEDFMQGYGWEDTDFGERFKRAGLTYKIRDDIQAKHMPHPRPSGSPLFLVNKVLHEKNNENKVIRPKNGLVKFD